MEVPIPSNIFIGPEKLPADLRNFIGRENILRINAKVANPQNDDGEPYLRTSQ